MLRLKNFFCNHYKVEMHEAYLEQLKIRFDELKPLYNRIAVRESIIEERLQLEVLDKLSL